MMGHNGAVIMVKYYAARHFPFDKVLRGFIISNNTKPNMNAWHLSLELSSTVECTYYHTRGQIIGVLQAPTAMCLLQIHSPQRKAHSLLTNNSIKLSFCRQKG